MRLTIIGIACSVGLLGVVMAWAATPGASAGKGAPGPAKVNVLTVMPFGDAVTQGDKDHSSYRYWLYKRLHESGYRASFVGSMTQNYAPTPGAAATPRGVVTPGSPGTGAPGAPGAARNPKTDFDLNHEGHWEWTTTAALEQIAKIAALKPRYVLIHLGSNDLDRPDAAAADLGRIIDAFRKESSHVVILLAQIIPAKGREDATTAFNKGIARLGKTKYSIRAPLIVVDLAKGFNPDKLTYDGARPNENGEKLVADRFFGAMQPLLDGEAPVSDLSFGGRLAKFNNHIRSGDYGGISYEAEEMRSGGQLSGQEFSEVMDALELISTYANAQRDRAKYLAEQRRYYLAGPIYDRLARQFRGVNPGLESRDQLEAWGKNPTIAAELKAGRLMFQADHDRAIGYYIGANTSYEAVRKEFPGTQAAAEAKRISDDLEKRGLLKKD